MFKLQGPFIKFFLFLIVNCCFTLLIFLICKRIFWSNLLLKSGMDYNFSSNVTNLNRYRLELAFFKIFSILYSSVFLLPKPSHHHHHHHLGLRRSTDHFSAEFCITFPSIVVLLHVFLALASRRLIIAVSISPCLDALFAVDS